MGLLEKLRSQPRWKHPDPVVRMASLYALGPEDLDTVRIVALEDSDARVRRAAVSRLTDVSTLANLAATDPDDEVRVEAVRALAGMAVEATDVAVAGTIVRSLIDLGRLKEVAAVARDHPDFRVRAAIVDAVDDLRTLSAISRHARDAATRMHALERVIDSDELQNVALKSSYTDVGLAALERIGDPHALTAVAEHARSKVVARRARTRLRIAEDGSQQDVIAVSAMSPDARARAERLIRELDGLLAESGHDEAAEALTRVRVAWAELQADVLDLDLQLVERFDSTSEAVREGIADRERERKHEHERAATHAREQADREAICLAIASLTVPGDAERLAELMVAWDQLAPMPSEYASALTRRFKDACRDFHERERREVLARVASNRMATLADELEQLLGLTQPLGEIVERWRGLRRDAESLLDHADRNPDAASRILKAIEMLDAREREHSDEQQHRAQSLLKQVEQRCRYAESLIESETFSLKSGERALREVHAALESGLPLPTRQDRQCVRERLERARSALGPRVQQLRDADEWQRWANLQIQSELCAEMEALVTEEDANLASRRMRELQGRWKAVALAPRLQGESVWRRFKKAQDAVYAKSSSHFEAQRDERAANLTRKTTLCERAEALSASTDWVKTAKEIQALQANWKTIGAIPRGRERAAWDRFRRACDMFFSRRHEDLQRRKDEWTTNLAAKVALIERAEALSESTDWEATSAALKALQVEWKAIGPVRRSKSDAVWQRFRGACDHFFERYKHRHKSEVHDRVAAREAVLRGLGALVSPPAEVSGGPPAGLADRVAEARQQWQQVRGLPASIEADLAARFRDVTSRLAHAWPDSFVGTDLDVAASRKRREKFVRRAELLAESAESAESERLSPAEQMAKQLRERLAANRLTGGSRDGSGQAGQTQAVEEELRSLRAQWSRLGPVPDADADTLARRFEDACRRVHAKRS